MTGAFERERENQLREIAEDLALEVDAARETFRLATAGAVSEYDRAVTGIHREEVAKVLRALDDYRRRTQLERKARDEAIRSAHRRADVARDDVERYYRRIGEA